MLSSWGRCTRRRCATSTSPSLASSPTCSSASRHDKDDDDDDSDDDDVLPDLRLLGAARCHPLPSILFEACQKSLLVSAASKRAG
eukprot:278107-Rhodomonas_salina.2